MNSGRGRLGSARSTRRVWGVASVLAVLAVILGGQYFFQGRFVASARTGAVRAVAQVATCEINILSPEVEFGAGGGAGVINVTAAANCSRTATTAESWIRITSGATATGSGTVGYSVSANAGPERSGTIFIAGLAYSIRQLPSCSFSINPKEQNIGAGGGSGTVAVSTSAGCTWTAGTVMVAEPELPRTYLDTTYTPSQRTPIYVPAGGDLQAAIDRARAGDVITLQAGASFTGNFTLPPKSGTDWITIRTSAPDSSLPAPGTRITPSFAGALARILTPNVAPAIEALSGAHHYRLIGLEIAAAPSAPFVYSLITLGGGETSLAQLPHNLILDRLYIHGSARFTLRRGVQLNSASTAIIDSYISDCHEVGVDSQAIGGWNSPGPIKIVNNYLEGAGENFMLGGADPTIPNLVPSDIEFRRNHCFKPLSWRIEDPSYGGIAWGVKNLFELKNAQRVLVDGNLFENNWTMGQNGFAILFTVRNQDGTAPWSVVQDVTFTNNIVRRAGAGVNVLATDDNHPSMPTVRLKIANNLLDDIDGTRWRGSGAAFQIGAGPEHIVIDHNTVLHGGNVISAYGAPARGLIFRNNLLRNNEYGIKGDNRSTGNATINTYLPGSLIRRNVLIGGSSTAYPAGNFFPATVADVGFSNFSGGDYRLAVQSPYRNAATDGEDIGCNFQLLDAAMNGGASLPVGTLSASPWIKVTAGASGTGSGAVTYSVAPNTGPARTGVLLIAGQTMQIHQEANCPGISIPPMTLPAGMRGTAYNQSLTATGGIAPYRYTVLSGALPVGMRLQVDGTLNGTPVQSGRYDFSVQVTDAVQCFAMQSFSLLIELPEGSGPARPGDFDGDGKTDFALWRGPVGDWILSSSSTGITTTYNWGSSISPYNDVAVPGDYDGDGRFDYAVWRQSTGAWYVMPSGDPTPRGETLGQSGDVPVPGDYDGDGKTDLAVWRKAGGIWLIRKSTDGQLLSQAWGSGVSPHFDRPVPADYDGDGKTDLAVWRESNGFWYILKSSDGQLQAANWGAARAPYNDVPVPADYDGDGKADIAVWRRQDGFWYIIKSGSGLMQFTLWGSSARGDIPVPGDFDGDGKADICVWRPGDGAWYVLRSSDGEIISKSLGQAGDTPVSKQRR